MIKIYNIQVDLCWENHTERMCVCCNRAELCIYLLSTSRFRPSVIIIKRERSKKSGLGIYQSKKAGEREQMYISEQRAFNLLIYIYFSFSWSVWALSNDMPKECYCLLAFFSVHFVVVRMIGFGFFPPLFFPRCVCLFSFKTTFETKSDAPRERVMLLGSSRFVCWWIVAGIEKIKIDADLRKDSNVYENLRAKDMNPSSIKNRERTAHGVDHKMHICTTSAN